jgi:hypothetical protein
MPVASANAAIKASRKAIQRRPSAVAEEAAVVVKASTAAVEAVAPLPLPLLLLLPPALTVVVEGAEGVVAAAVAEAIAKRTLN